MYRRAYAIARALGGDRKTASRGDLDDEEVIDTTTPEFAEHFKGFTNTKQSKVAQQQFRQMSTEIIMG